MVTFTSQDISTGRSAYTREPNLPSLASGESAIFTFNVNTESTSASNIDATPAASGWTGEPKDDERIP